jgi:hypothetical membrane protein
LNKYTNSNSILAGLIAPVFYIVLVSILGLLEPNFSHKTDMMSILGGVEGIRGQVFNVGVVITGLLLIVFAYGLHQNINKGAGSKIGPILIVLAGLGLIGSAIFSCNINCLNVIETRTTIGVLHMISAFVAGSSLAISPFFIFFRMKKDPLWKKYRSFTLSIGILSNLPGIVLWVSIFTIRIPEWEGVIQRLGLLFPFIWIFVLSLRQLLLKTSGNQIN